MSFPLPNLEIVNVVLSYFLIYRRGAGVGVRAPASKSEVRELSPALVASQTCFSVAPSSTPWSRYQSMCRAFVLGLLVLFNHLRFNLDY